MSSSQRLGNLDELSGGDQNSSTESGWTSYLASPFQENNFNDDDDDEDDDDRNIYKLRNDQNDDSGGGGESDDSIASDASSGPCRSDGGSHRVSSACYKNPTAKNSSEGKLQKQERQNAGGKSKKAGKDEKKSLLQETSATSNVQSGTKARETK